MEQNSGSKVHTDRFNVSAMCPGQSSTLAVLNVSRYHIIPGSCRDSGEGLNSVEKTLSRDPVPMYLKPCRFAGSFNFWCTFELPEPAGRICRERPRLPCSNLNPPSVTISTRGFAQGPRLFVLAATGCRVYEKQAKISGTKFGFAEPQPLK